jgi:RES domain-containing protein
VITAWHICRARWAARALSGEGAAKYPGRWNNAATKIVYLAESRSLAALEVLANVEDPLVMQAAAWVAIPVSFDEALVLKPSKFPADWRSIVAPKATRDFGDRWIKDAATVVMRVPSVVTLGEFDYLINPAHSDFPSLQVGKPENLVFDPRVLR